MSIDLDGKIKILICLPGQDPGSFGVEGEALDPLRLRLKLGQHFEEFTFFFQLKFPDLKLGRNKKLPSTIWLE